jgi:NADPH:quinone reductase-like Zn-dependent oxidoreductase
VEFLTKELGFTSAFNYKKESYAEALKRLAPDGIDIYYDNVGGEALDEALSAMKQDGRIGKLDWTSPRLRRMLIPMTSCVRCDLTVQQQARRRVRGQEYTHGDSQTSEMARFPGL